jgi:coenzyme F420 hydrogenase subunit beta
MIEQVYKNKLCTGCGTCLSVCPNNAIKIVKDEKKGVYKPKVDKNKCNKCGLCLKVCPGWQTKINNNLIGNNLKIFSGKSRDSNLSKISSSGGSITQVLLYLIKKGEIDGALVTIMDGLVPKPIIAKNEKDIISAIGSKYCPVPLNVELRNILESKVEKIAFVGLPCHVQGLNNLIKIKPELGKKIYITLGIFCSRTPTFIATENLLKKLNLKTKDIKSINYRCKYDMVITLKNGHERIIPYRNYWNSDFKYLISPRCIMCHDRLNDFSDLSFGDDWENKSNIIIARTKKGLETIKKVKDIELQELTIEGINNLKKQSIFKKKNLAARLFFLKIFKIKTPRFDKEIPKPGISAYPQALLFLMRTQVATIKSKFNK